MGIWKKISIIISSENILCSPEPWVPVSGNKAERQRSHLSNCIGIKACWHQSNIVARTWSLLKGQHTRWYMGHSYVGVQHVQNQASVHRSLLRATPIQPIRWNRAEFCQAPEWWMFGSSKLSFLSSVLSRDPTSYPQTICGSPYWCQTVQRCSYFANGLLPLWHDFVLSSGDETAIYTQFSLRLLLHQPPY
jgi:hypothetical protein